MHTLQPVVAWQAWYLDDGILVGTRAQRTTALGLLTDRFATLGLQVNLQKCELWGPMEVTVPDGTPSLLTEVTRIPLDRGFKVLGAPLDPPGKGAQTAAVWLTRLQGMARLLRALEQFPQLHIQYTLLRACLDACKVTDLLRVS